MFLLQHYIDARYYLEEAILKSCARENKLNAFVSSISTVLLSKINEKEDISEIKFLYILIVSEILAKSENYTIKNKKCKTYTRPIINNISSLDKNQNTEVYIKKRKIKLVYKNKKSSSRVKINPNENKKSMISAKKITKNRKTNKITFKKTKTVTSLLTFSNIAHTQKQKPQILRKDVRIESCKKYSNILCKKTSKSIKLKSSKTNF